MSSASDTPEFAAEQSAAARTGPRTRLFDFFCALVGVIFLCPVLFLIALAIKLGDGGPVLFSQHRVGRNFRAFRLYKFRSMIPGSDRKTGLTAPGDSRVTRVGRILRRYKLDEFPQLFNVLKGDMQLVGVRPEVEYYVQMFQPQYAILLKDRPGITDAASLAYRHEEEILFADRLEQQYAEEVLPAKLALSLEYQRRRTFSSDMGILFRTVLKSLE